MTLIWALKDSLSGEYLAKNNALQRLSTTTRTFQRQRKAQEVADDYYTYFWIAVKEKTYGRRRYRVDMQDKNFVEYIHKLFKTRRLEPVEVSIHELYEQQI